MSQKQKTDFLTLEKNNLEEKLVNTNESLIEVTAEYDNVLREKNHWQQTAQDFQAKYEALLRETQSVSVRETKKPSPQSLFA